MTAEVLAFALVLRETAFVYSPRRSSRCESASTTYETSANRWDSGELKICVPNPFTSLEIPGFALFLKNAVQKCSRAGGGRSDTRQRNDSLTHLFSPCVLREAVGKDGTEKQTKESLVMIKTGMLVSIKRTPTQSCVHMAQANTQSASCHSLAGEPCVRSGCGHVSSCWGRRVLHGPSVRRTWTDGRQPRFIMLRPHEPSVVLKRCCGSGVLISGTRARTADSGPPRCVGGKFQCIVNKSAEKEKPSVNQSRCYETECGTAGFTPDASCVASVSQVCCSGFKKCHCGIRCICGELSAPQFWFGNLDTLSLNQGLETRSWTLDMDIAEKHPWQQPYFQKA